MVDIHKDDILQAYEDVRNDSTPTAWAVLTYDNNTIVLNSTGTCYDEFLSKFTDDTRVFGFVRVATGDELSKRTKFVLITWIGTEVNALKRAKVSTDKTAVKSVMSNYALEIQTSEKSELQLDYLQDAVRKAGGANYGTGVRD